MFGKHRKKDGGNAYSSPSGLPPVMEVMYPGGMGGDEIVFFSGGGKDPLKRGLSAGEMLRKEY